MGIHGNRSLLLAAFFAALTYGSGALADSFYTVHNLVSNVPGVGVHTDSNLKNGWGIAAGPTSPIWVANNGTGTSTLYDGNGVAQSLVVSIPAPGGGPGASRPASYSMAPPAISCLLTAERLERHHSFGPPKTGPLPRGRRP